MKWGENIQINPQFPLKKRTRKISDKKRLVKQYRAVLTLLKNPSCVERGVFDKFPILPPDLRPILQLGDVKAVSDMTSLYILLIQRNIRHGKILFESYGESNEFLIGITYTGTFMARNCCTIGPSVNDNTEDDTLLSSNLSTRVRT
jgi:hypothetical protein